MNHRGENLGLDEGETRIARSGGAGDGQRRFI
jgi:hypothetical protein